MSKTLKIGLLLGTVLASLVGVSGDTQAQFSFFTARDPGVRGGDPGAGGPIGGLAADEFGYFNAGLEEFQEIEGVGNGLGPRFNLDSCVGCHSQPAAGGTSPDTNPQVAVATAFGARNFVPSFITLNGPVREVRFKYRPDGTRDGGVHALFVISGRRDPTGDASGCSAVQPDFGAELGRGNVTFRIPSPMFGAGLIEQIPDSAILANQVTNYLVKSYLGISGRPNRNGNDGTVTRFGWKAQNKSLLLFSGEAYNVEMGITSELFPAERDDNPTCQISSPGGSDSIARGKQLFTYIGCGLCHTPTLRTGNSTVAALRNQEVNLYSDLLLHAMGPGLADDIVQGSARPDEFRTPPLWGLGQRIFLLHDGRTTDLVTAIRAHRSAWSFRFGPSEANAVVDNFNDLGEYDKQHLLNFLRSL
jgi:CxxC motif-containing protein (DUF1111 family)